MVKFFKKAIKLILEFQQNSTLCGGQNKNQQNEKLFTI